MNQEPDSLLDRLILLIEEDGFLAGYIEDGLRRAGAQILGPARSVDEANVLLARLRTVPDAAVIGISVFEAAGSVMNDAIARLGIPLLLIARRPRALPPSSLQHSILATPFAAYQVVDHVRAVVPEIPPPTSFVPLVPRLSPSVDIA